MNNSQLRCLRYRTIVLLLQAVVLYFGGRDQPVSTRILLYERLTCIGQLGTSILLLEHKMNYEKPIAFEIVASKYWTVSDLPSKISRILIE